MWLINLARSLFRILKVNTLECLSVINRECMPRPKILDVNEGVGEALFYPYNVLVNKCSGSCNTFLIHQERKYESLQFFDEVK